MFKLVCVQLRTVSGRTTGVNSKTNSLVPELKANKTILMVSTVHIPIVMYSMMHICQNLEIIRVRISCKLSQNYFIN